MHHHPHNLHKSMFLRLKREGRFPWKVQEHYSDADGANYKFVIVGDSARRRRKVGKRLIVLFSLLFFVITFSTNISIYVSIPG